MTNAEDLAGTWSKDALYAPGAQSDRCLYLRADGTGARASETPYSTEATVLTWELDGGALVVTEHGLFGQVEGGPWERADVHPSRRRTSFTLAVEDTPVRGALPVLRSPADVFARVSDAIPRRIVALLDQVPVTPRLRVSVPTPELAEAVADLAEAVVWDLTGPPPLPDLDLVVQPYMSSPSLLAGLAGVRVVQSQSIGFDGVAAALPEGVTFCNAAGVHEASTAELAVGLILASLRQIPAFVTAQFDGRWLAGQYEALADKTVVVIGVGGIGQAVVDRLRPFEVTIVPVASRARDDVHGISELPSLLPAADVVVLAVPLNDSTRGLVSTSFLSDMKPGALLVNVSRGPVVDTEALTAFVTEGRVRAALDVTDPEPLPADHPLWRLPGVLISPHVGGNTTAMFPRVVRLVRAQLGRLAAGEPLENVVL